MKHTSMPLSCKALLFTGLLTGTALLPQAGKASFAIPKHVVDGQFTSPIEWTGPLVSEVSFPTVGNAGGANLFVEQSPATLFLMYDYVGSNAQNFSRGNAFFDVFFEVNSTKDKGNYLVRILPDNSFLAFERPQGSLAPLAPDGSFDIGAGSGWNPLSAADLQRAQFQTAIGVGHNPATPDVADHLLAEFSLSIGRPDGNPNGLYSPDPAFWSASVDGTITADPPISSGIFVLNPDGSTLVTPVLDVNRAPVKQPTPSTPEPSSIVLLISASSAGFLLRNRRRK